MKKYYRIISIIIIVITISFILDLVCIYTINKPLFAIKNKDDCGMAISFVGKLLTI